MTHQCTGLGKFSDSSGFGGLTRDEVQKDRKCGLNLLKSSQSFPKYVIQPIYCVLPFLYWHELVQMGTEIPRMTENMIGFFPILVYNFRCSQLSICLLVLGSVWHMVCQYSSDADLNACMLLRSHFLKQAQVRQSPICKVCLASRYMFYRVMALREFFIQSGSLPLSSRNQDEKLSS